MVRTILVGILVLGFALGEASAAENGVRVADFGPAADKKAQALTRQVKSALSGKGYATKFEGPEPGLLQEIKTRALVSGESVDEIKGLQIGARYLVTGSYSAEGDALSATARVIDMQSGEVVSAFSETGDSTDAVAEKLASRIASDLGRPADETKVERVEVRVVGQAPGKLPTSTGKRIALADAKRNAIEQAVGAVVDVKRVPDAKSVKATAQSSLSYRVVEEKKDDGRYTVEIVAMVDIPADLASKYPAPARLVSDETGFSAYVERSEKGEIDWEKGVLRVVGRSKAGKQGDVKAELLSRRAAIADAYARAMEVVAGVRIEGSQTVGDAAKKDQGLNVQIRGLVQGGKVVGETPRSPKGEHEVTLEVPMRGLRGIQSVFLDRLGTPKQSSGQLTNVADETEGEFTGILIDARGTGLNAGMFPQLLDENGNVIADPADSDADILREKGQAAYVVGDPDKQGFMHERLGPNPLVFQATLGEPYEVAGIEPLILTQQRTFSLKRSESFRQGPAPLKVKVQKNTGPTKVNMLVSTSYKDRDKFTQNLKKAFGKCKVVVVMDSQIGGTEGRLLSTPETFAFILE